jgi:cell division protein FtsX
MHPTLLEGRAPRAADEVVLGSGTLRHLHKRVGDTVMGSGKDLLASERLRIVGRASFPELGNNGDVAHMASVSSGALDRLGFRPLESLVLVRVRPGVSPEAVLRRHEVPDQAETVLAHEPATVHNLAAVGVIPWALAAFLSALAGAAVGHALFMSVHARRVEIAVLRTLGLVRRQVRWSVAFQASTTVLVGAIVGIPIGIAVGRWTWISVARGLGVVERPVVAAGLIALAAALALVLANVLASVPAVVASRLRPAEILRTE